MRAVSFAFAVCVTGCRAVLGIEEGEPALADVAAARDAVVDAVAEADAMDAGTSDVTAVDGGFDGCGIVPGTTVTATKTTAEYGKPQAMLDGNIETFWGPGDYRTRIQLTFPRPLTLGSGRVATYASPAGVTATYKFTGWVGTTAISIGTRTVVVPNDAPPKWMPSMPLGGGTFDALTIEVDAGGSWVAIGELAFGSTIGACAS